MQEVTVGRATSSLLWPLERDQDLLVGCHYWRMHFRRPLHTRTLQRTAVNIFHMLLSDSPGNTYFCCNTRVAVRKAKVKLPSCSRLGVTTADTGRPPQARLPGRAQEPRRGDTRPLGPTPPTRRHRHGRERTAPPGTSSPGRTGRWGRGCAPGIHLPAN